MNYQISMVVKPLEYDEGFGWKPKLVPEFDAVPTMSHDLFEHWFERTNFLKTKELSHVGEAVAIGIRTYFDENSKIVHNHMNFNQFRGVEWNSWNTLLQIYDDLDQEFPQYSTDLSFMGLRWKKENYFKGYLKSYDQSKSLSANIRTQLEIGISYGYWLGQKMFKDRLNEIDEFLFKIKPFIPEQGDFHMNFGKKIIGSFSKEKYKNYIIIK